MSAKWVLEGGVYYTAPLPPSEGVTGPRWIERLDSKGFRVTPDGESFLRSNDFKPTVGVVHRLAILPARFFPEQRRRTRFIREEGQDRRWNELNPEAICILRENFSDDDLLEMGFQWIVGVHEPVRFNFDLHLIGMERRGVGRWIHAACARPLVGWREFGAFAWSL